MEFCLEPEAGLHVKSSYVIDPRQAALFGMASVAMRSCRQADLRRGDRLLIVDAGFVGLAAAQIAAAIGGDGWERNIRDGEFRVVLDVAGVPGIEQKLIADLDNLCRLVQRIMVRLAPLICDIVPVAEAKRVYDTLRDEPARLFGTVFDWSSP